MPPMNAAESEHQARDDEHPKGGEREGAKNVNPTDDIRRLGVGQHVLWCEVSECLLAQTR